LGFPSNSYFEATRGDSLALPRLTRRPPLKEWVVPTRSRPLAPLASVLTPCAEVS